MTPIIYPRSESGLRTPVDPDKFGPLGEIYAFTFHHSAGPRARNKERCQELNLAYQIAHQNKGWGDIAYHFCMDDHGRIYRLRDIDYKGAHVGGWNTGNVGFMIHGNYMHDQLNDAQKESIKWIFQGGLLVLTGEREAGFKLVRGHQEWNGHNSNACPGTELMRHLRWRRGEDF